jgi:YgiT-type zinc finger domain-containing protein
LHVQSALHLADHQLKELKGMSDNQFNGAPTMGICRECQAGIVRLRHLTYFTYLNDELITVPNFPAWVCDVCGRREYDVRAITWLNTMLNPETGRRNPARRKPGIRPTDQPHT